MIVTLIVCIAVVILAALAVYAYIVHIRTGRTALDQHGVPGLTALTTYSAAWPNPLTPLATTTAVLRPAAGPATTHENTQEQASSPLEGGPLA